MARLAVLGATSWGLTLATLLHRNGNHVTVITRSPEEAANVAERRGIARMPDLVLAPNIAIVAAPVSEQFEGVVVGCPAQSVRKTISASGLIVGTPLVSASKGIEHGTGMRMSEVLASLGWPAATISSISGPNLAHEIARGLPATAVVASSGAGQAAMWQQAISAPTFRVYTTDDITGVEIGGAYKNVIAIAAGAAWGSNFGANTVSSILTRGLAEMSRFGVALGADAQTFLGLAGVGDLATTCFSPLSRNRRFGEYLAQGQSVAEARASIGEAVEGIATATVALEVAAKVDVELPICAAVAAVVSESSTIMQAMTALLTRPLRDEAASGA